MQKVTFLFWNINQRPLLSLIDAIVREQRVDVLVLAECKIPDVALLQGLNANESAKFSLPFSPADNLKFLIRFPREALQPVSDGAGLSIRQLCPPIGLDILLVAAHLPSKLHLSEADQAMLCARVIADIEEAEQTVGHARTVIFGDLNMNPFEAGVIGSEGFHAVMSRRIAAKGQRTVLGRERAFFYNPMWSYFGDVSPGPVGTYYYNKSAPVNYFWHIFDQVLLRPDLLPRFADGDLEILTRAGDVSLLAEEQTPDRRIGSDHLPILFRINIEEELRI